MHLDLRAIVDTGHLGLLVQRHAQLLGNGSLTQCQVQRVQMAGTHVDHAAYIAIRADYGAHLAGLQQAHFVAVAQAAQLFGILG